MSYRLVYPYKEVEVRPSLAKRIREIFGLDFGYIVSIPVTVVFERTDGTWTTGINMILDTGAGISLLPARFYEELQVDRYVEHEVLGVSRDRPIPVRISKVRSKLIDAYGNSSPEFDLWVSFAERDDVPSVLGTKDVMYSFKFESDPSEKKLYLTWRR